MRTERQIRRRLSDLRRRIKRYVKAGGNLFGVMLAQAAEEQLVWMLKEDKPCPKTPAAR